MNNVKEVTQKFWFRQPVVRVFRLLRWEKIRSLTASFRSLLQVYPIWALIGAATLTVSYFAYRNFALHGDIMYANEKKFSPTKSRISANFAPVFSLLRSVNKKNPWQWRNKETPKLSARAHTPMYAAADLETDAQ